MAAARTEKSFSLEAAAAASQSRGGRSQKLLAQRRKTQRTSSGRGSEERFAKSCREKRVAESLFAKPRAASVTEGFSEPHTLARARSSDIPGPVVSSEPLRLHARLSLSGNAAISPSDPAAEFVFASIAGCGSLAGAGKFFFLASARASSLGVRMRSRFKSSFV